MNDLYSEHAKKFSDTRQYPWKGWKELIEKHELQFSNCHILDLGCGNGRFLKFLIENNIQIKNYLGVDNSQILLNIAKKYDAETFANFDFKKLDLNQSNWGNQISPLFNENFNLVVAFGIMHHINPFEQRKNFLKQSLELLTENGLLIVTYWQFGKLERYKDKMQRAGQNKGTKYCEHDYVMGFGDSQNSRFCHYCSEEEVKELESELNISPFISFLSDGRDLNENLYRIYKKL